MGGNLNQFLLLLKKNWLIQKRKTVATIFEITLPMFFAIILLGVRQIVDVRDITEPTTWEPFSVEQFREDLIPPSDNASISNGMWKLAYSPNHPSAKLMVEEMASSIGVVVNGLGFATEQDMVNYIMTENTSTVDVLGGIAFQNQFYDNATIPEKVSYKIRLRSEQYFGRGSTLRFYVASDWYTSFMLPVYPDLGPRQRKEDDGGAPGYNREGFLTIQRALDLSILSFLNASSIANEIYLFMQRFPYPPYIDDEFLEVLEDNFAFTILLSFIVTAPNIVKDLVLEKERRLRETMKMMGLKVWLSWIAWFVKYFMFMMISVLLMTFFFHLSVGNGAVINFSAPTVTFVFLLLYAIATIMFCFMISTFVSKANTGAAAGAILFLVTYLPFSFLRIPGRWETLTVADKMAASLVSNTAMALGCVQLASFEIAGIGLTWDNVNEPINSDNGFTMVHVFIMLIVDSILYGIITWYVDAVFPGEYGVPLPLYFPFTKSYWCDSTSGADDIDDREPDFGDKTDYFEDNFSSQEAGIRIRNLTKEFKKGGVAKLAVDSLNLDIYSGQITALLGHNGAGKTTTISMLTGLIQPTQGTASILGHDIRKDMTGVRESLGICPQHDVLFDTLTVEEHLEFFAMLKGFPRKQVKAEVSEMLKVLHLENKRKCQSRTLSGGMKRKLCVGIALIGGSKIVILDEPTSGMDPEARRKTWDILQNQRMGRTIILTTHFMDEADFLGDRIAIMASGVVQCCGSSMFLKNKYGVGYHMGIVKSATCDPSKVTTIIQSYVPNAEVESNISAELSYVLPSESLENFEKLFDNLEKDKQQLGILSYGVSVTTLEEVFLKVGEQHDSSLLDKLQNGITNQSNREINDLPSHQSSTEGYNNSAYDIQDDGVDMATKETSSKPAFGIHFTKNVGLSLYIQQFYAMFMKKVIYSWRNKVVTTVQILVPFGFSLIPCILVYTLPGPRDAPPLTIDLSGYDAPESPYNVLNESSSDVNLLYGLGDVYKDSLKDKAAVTFVNEYSTDPNMTTYLLQQSEDLNSYRQSDMTAATFEGNSTHSGMIGNFNNQGYHSTAQILNVLSNTLMKYFVEVNNSIETINHPLPRAASVGLEEDLNTAIPLAIFLSYNVLFGMCFLMSTFVLFLIRERVSKSKHIQFVSGVHITNYWSANFIWDMMTYLVPCFLLLILFVAFDIEGFYKSGQWGVMLVLFLVFGFAILPAIYLWSFLFDVPASGYVWAVVTSLLLGSITNMVTGFLLYSYVVEVGVEVGTILDWIFTVLLPPYNLCTAMQDLFLNYERKTACGSITEINQFCLSILVKNTTHPCCLGNCGINCAVYHDNAFEWEFPGIGRRLTFMALEGVLFFALLLFIESGVWRKLLTNSYESYTSDNEEYDSIEMEKVNYVDDDVQLEQNRINKTPTTELLQDVLILKNLTKSYDGFNRAVDGLTVGVPSGECFGLLGVNGAGKTTTFKMLTGDVVLSAGEAFVAGYSVMNNIKKVQQNLDYCPQYDALIDQMTVTEMLVQQNLGYCPQYDALIDQMTVTETLVMYARLRGVQEDCVFPLVDRMISQLLLDDFRDKQAGTLSGGNKRKLCTAISLVGEPPIVFLDEPTTGMDPVARRLLWDALTKFRASGRTLVLTSHSMEECEALCTRLAIMVNGQFKCLGSTQHLKNKFGEGYTLMAKIKSSADANIEDKTNRLRQFIEFTCPGSILKDLHHGYIHYQISNDNLTWSQVFGLMEKVRETYGIEDYSVSQTTLEQVFLNFAKNQVPPNEVDVGCMKVFCGCCKCCCDDKNSNIVHSTHL